MAIPLSDYAKIHSRPGRKRSGDDGFEISAEDERILDRVWARSADRHGVEQLPDQPTEDEILSSVS
jgi:hypothetical protein